MVLRLATAWCPGKYSHGSAGVRLNHLHSRCIKTDNRDTDNMLREQRKEDFTRMLLMSRHQNQFTVGRIVQLEGMARAKAQG